MSRTENVIETPPGRQLNQAQLLPQQGREYRDALEANLRHATECFILQKVDVVNLAVGYKMPNRYKVVNQAGVPFLKVTEDSDEADRFCAGEERDLVLLMFDVHGQRVMSVYRPYQCCGDTLKVEYPLGIEMAVIERTSNMFCCCSRQKFSVYSVAEGAKSMYILGPPICNGCMADESYDVSVSTCHQKCTHVPRSPSLSDKTLNAYETRFPTVVTVIPV